MLAIYYLGHILCWPHIILVTYYILHITVNILPAGQRVGDDTPRKWGEYVFTDLKKETWP